MRSLLFVPADGGPKLDKALASGADAVIVDLEDLIVPERKPAAREAALAFLKKAGATKQRPRLLVRINGLDTGMTDADLDAIVAGRPDAVVFPKAEGGPSVVHLDAKLTAREAVAGIPEGHIKILAQAVELAAGLFAAGNFRNASPRLIGLTWGPEDLSADSSPTTTLSLPLLSLRAPPYQPLFTSSPCPHPPPRSSPSIHPSFLSHVHPPPPPFPFPPPLSSPSLPPFLSLPSLPSRSFVDWARRQIATRREN